VGLLRTGGGAEEQTNRHSKKRKSVKKRRRGRRHIPKKITDWPVYREHFWANWRVSSKKTNETLYAEF